MLRMFVSRVLRKIFVCKWDGVTGDWIRLHNEELHNLYCTLNVMVGGKIKKNETGEGRDACTVLVGILQGRRDHLYVTLGLNGRIILKGIFKT
jgi:hypothetical protein